MSAFVLRLLACICMLADHIGILVGSNVLRAIGRMAMPLFAFLIYNGFIHTSNRSRYALRLFVFAVISQVPYCLFGGYSLLGKGNVLFSLLLGLLVLWAVDSLRQHKVLKWFCWVPVLAAMALYFFGIFASDYNVKITLLILVFYCFGRKSFWSIAATVVAMAMCIWYDHLLSLAVLGLKWILGSSGSLPTVTRWNLMQNFALLSVVPMVFYNGKKGPKISSSKVMQYGFYLFYPVHLLILWAIRVFL